MLPLLQDAKRIVNSDYFTIINEFLILLSSFPIEKYMMQKPKFDQHIDKYVFYNPTVCSYNITAPPSYLLSNSEQVLQDYFYSRSSLLPQIKCNIPLPLGKIVFI